MAVSIITPQQQEAGIDKFLRRAGSVAGLAKGGLDAYQGFTDFQDKQQALADQKAGVRLAKDIDMAQFQEAAEGDAGAEAFKIRDGDSVITRMYKKRAAEAKAVNPLEQDKLRAEIDKIKAETGKAKREGTLSEADAFKKLNPLDRISAEDLTKKNASIVTIKNSIDSVMGGWDKLSDDQKLAQGRMLLKTLNSSQGADAIGSEEAKRLGSKLEFAMGNLLNSNPIQFGRDLPGFAEQARGTAENLGKTIEANQSQIKGLVGNLSGRGLSELVKSKPAGNPYQNMSGKEPAIGARGLPEKPKTVRQNGHTYTLNEKTGQYE